MAEPIASGSLRKTPLPHLLIYLEQKRLNGTLAIWPEQAQEGDTRQDRILMLKGKPVAGRFMQPASSLLEGLLPLFLRQDAPYAFYDGNLLGGTDDRINGRIDPLALIAESLRTTSRDDVIAEVLARFDGVKLRLQPDVDFKRYGFVEEERALIELLQAEPMGIAELAAGSSLSAARARRLIYLLTISKAVAPYAGEAQARAETVERRSQARQEREQEEQDTAEREAAAQEAAATARAARAAEAGAAGPSVPPDAEQYRSASATVGGSRPDLDEMPAPPAELSEELRKRWQLMVTKGKLIENQNYFEMLGVEREAKPADIRGRFFKLAKEWHPDRLPPELSPLKPYADTIFGFMSEAHSTLVNENTRVTYTQTVREGGGTPATEKLMESILDSAMQYEKVLVMTRKHEYDDALKLLRQILSLTKDEPEYIAMHVWLLMKKFPGNDAPLAEMLDMCDAAIKLYERHEKSHLYKGQVLKRMGKPKEALRCFKKVVEINPRNVDAAREVRVANMRGPSGADSNSIPPGTGDEGGGLLGKLFKKKKP